MDAPVLTKWLADLRSGQFTQTKSNLRDANGFCCLGVLANQFADTWIGDPSCRMVPKREGRHLSASTSDNPNNHSGFLGAAFMIEIGLDGRLASDGIYMNDRRVPFPVIADYIEDWHAKAAAGENPAELLDAEAYTRKVLAPVPRGWESVEA
ncbi:hypothetical protein ACTG4Q_20820 [Bradyrhizobium denitrificans]